MLPRPISIHAAREGGDVIKKYPSRSSHISIHAAREGGDRAVECLIEFARRFQSTPPVKAATWAEILLPDAPKFQSTPPVKAATGTYGGDMN